MKEREFTELLNLYLDHEITPEAAARLEAEVQRNPARRATYRQYCQMQKACKILSAEFAATSGSETVMQGAGRTKPATQSWNGGAGNWRTTLLGAGGLFVAASVAIVAYVNLGGVAQVSPGTQRSHAVTQSAVEGGRPSPGVTATRPLAATPATPTGGTTTGLIGRDANADMLALSFSRAPGTGLRVATHSEDQLEWVRHFQVVSMSERNRVTLPRFEPVPVTLRPDARAIRLASPVESAEETAAFRFLK